MTPPEVFSERRRRFAEALGDGVAVLASAPERTYSNDVHYEYRPSSDLYWLTGFREPDAVLVIAPAHDEHRYVLFVRPRDPEMEVWTGRRAGPEGVCRDYGAEAAYAIADLPQHLPRYLDGAPALHYRLNERADMDRMVLGILDDLRRQARAGRTAPPAIHDPGTILHELRLRKSGEELAMMRRAAEISAEGHGAAMAAVRPGMYEYELEAIIEYHFRRRGAFGPAYPSIVGSGPNACVLHYVDNDRRIEEGELVLVDAGAEFAMLNADITRTFPASGTFSAEQRALYEVVLDAQRKAIDAVRPGATVDGIHEGVVRDLVRGMVDVGLVSGPVDRVIEDETYKAYYMHRTSHWLGVDVHDVGSYHRGREPRPLEEGMVLTVEPGIYVAPDAADADERWRGIGIRIEDDVLVTGDGREVLSGGVPKEAEAVEELCGSAR